MGRVIDPGWPGPMPSLFLEEALGAAPERPSVGVKLWAGVERVRMWPTAPIPSDGRKPSASCCGTHRPEACVCGVGWPGSLPRQSPFIQQCHAVSGGPRRVGSAGLITGCRLPGILVSVFTPPFDFSPKPAFTTACWGIAVSCLHVKRPAWFPCCHIHRPAPWFVPVFHAHLQRGHSGPVQSVGEACASRSRPWLCVFPGSGRQWSSPLRRVSGEPCS